MKAMKKDPIHKKIMATRNDYVDNEMFDQRPVYTTSVLGTARLNLGTRTYEFWNGTLNFCRVNGYKTGPRAQKF